MIIFGMDFCFSKMHCCVKLAFCLAVVSVFQIGICDSELSRQKRDDADKVIITTIEEAPYVETNLERKAKGNAQFVGLIPDMLKQISDKIKLDYELRYVTDGKYGGPLADGKWSGMIGEIMDGRADMAAAPITISEERKKVVDFTEPFESFGTVMLMYDDPENPTNIKSIKDLADAKDITYGIIRDGVTEQFFRNSDDESYKKMWEHLQNNRETSVQDGVKKVRAEKGKYIFILESATAEYWVDKQPCELKIGDDRINEKSFGFALKKGSDRLDRFNQAIKDLKKENKIIELRRKWKSGECGKTIEDDTSNATKLSYVTSLVSVLVLGVLRVFGL